MKKLLGEILLFLVIICIANNIIISCFRLPDFWAIRWQKPVYYEKHKKEINCLFFGTSLTAHQIQPELFDSITNVSGIKTCSFNYGLDQGDFSEVFSTVHKINSNSTDTINYEIVELVLIDNSNPRYFGTLRFKSFYSLSHFYNSILLIQNSNLRPGRKAEEYFVSVHNYFEYIFKVDFMSGAIETKRNINKCSRSIDRGFEPAYYIDNSGNKDSVNLSYQLDKMSSTYLDSAIVASRSILTNKDYQNKSNINREYVLLVNQLIDEARKRGTHLIFLLPPRYNKSVYTYLVPVFMAIPEGNRINMADSEKFPQFYTLENSYDNRHLNYKGAKIYTCLLTDEFIALLHKQAPTQHSR